MMAIYSYIMAEFNVHTNVRQLVVVLELSFSSMSDTRDLVSVQCTLAKVALDKNIIVLRLADVKTQTSDITESHF